MLPATEWISSRWNWRPYCHLKFMKSPDTQRSIRIAMPEALYQELKKECEEHGEISQLIRKLLIKHLKSLSDKAD